MRIRLCDGEDALLREIADPAMHQRDVAMTYGLALRSGERVCWARINRAICERWSLSGLVRVKRMAWAWLRTPPEQR